MKVYLAALKERGVRPRVHGNGFIQVDITDQIRLHIWGHPDIPCQRVPTPIHDHIFGFKSTLLRGKLANVTYEFMPGIEGPFVVHEAVCREGSDTTLEPTDEQCAIRIKNVEIMVPLIAQNVYYMEPYLFHESVSMGPTVTILQKFGSTLAQGSKVKPRVLVPFGTKPDNKFNRYTCCSEEQMWRIVKNVAGNLCDL
jgi:hypothetical protein